MEENVCSMHMEDITNPACRPAAWCSWPGSACTQAWNNNCCLAFDDSSGNVPSLLRLNRQTSPSRFICMLERERDRKQLQWGHVLKQNRSSAGFFWSSCMAGAEVVFTFTLHKIVIVLVFYFLFINKNQLINWSISFKGWKTTHLFGIINQIGSIKQ